MDLCITLCIVLYTMYPTGEIIQKKKNVKKKNVERKKHYVQEINTVKEKIKKVKGYRVLQILRKYIWDLLMSRRVDWTLVAAIENPSHFPWLAAFPVFRWAEEAFNFFIWVQIAIRAFSPHGINVLHCLAFIFFTKYPFTISANTTIALVISM